ncbi:MAG: hypothetical protein WAS07_05185 [Micropruina sp.]
MKQRVLGCMSITGAYAAGSPDRADSIALIWRAVELGVTFFDQGLARPGRPTCLGSVAPGPGRQ